MWPQTALRLITLRRSNLAARSGTFVSIVLLSLLSLALWTGLDYLRSAPGSQFDPYELPMFAWFILAALLTAVGMAKRSHPAIEVSRVCAMLAIVIPLLIAADFAIDRYVPQQWAVFAFLALIIYTIAYFDSGLKSCSGFRQPVALAAGIAIAFAFLWLGNIAYVRPALWVEPDAIEEGPGEPVAEADADGSEEILFEQSARIDASLAKIVRPPGDTPTGFFVGFAGVGEQRVFAEEIKLAAQVFGKRYDTSARTLLLLNDQRDLDSEPLASVSGLRYALKGVATKMQLDRDILFLTLSSHGSEDPLLSVSNNSIPLQDLSGDDLAAALRESGIKWRVIVISACHAGAFIEQLQDPYTIVITAAAADRTSFGCSDDRDLTYFGEMFFRDSVPGAASLRAAFDATRKLIAKREQQENIEASEPQAFFGKEMEQRLQAFEKPAVEPPANRK